MGPGPRGKIKAAADYLAVAPQVVAVARDIDLGDARHRRSPARPADPDALADARRPEFGLDQPGRAADRQALRPTAAERADRLVVRWRP